MIDLVLLIWGFLAGQPADHFFRLLPWHLALLLSVLGLLAAFGLHFLIGHVFGFYRRKGRHAYWIALPTGLMLLVSVQLLLGAYVLGTRASELAALNLSEPLEGRLGEMLLAPAFLVSPLIDQPEDAVSGAALKAALQNSPDAEYRERLLALAEGPPPQLGAIPANAPVVPKPNLGLPDADTLNPNTRLLPPGHVPLDPRGGESGDSEDLSPVPGLTANEWRVARMGLRWVAVPHRTWLTPLLPHTPIGNEGAENDGAENTGKIGQNKGARSVTEDYFLPEFLQGLINEVPPDAILTREDWEHVAGTRFMGGIMEPLLVEYLSFLALTLALLVLLVLAVYAYIMGKLKRIGRKKSLEVDPAETGTEGSILPVATASATTELPVPAKISDAPIAVDKVSDKATDTASGSTENPSPPETPPADQAKP